MRFLACDTGLKSIHPMKRYSIDGLGSTVCKDSTRIYLIFESGLIAGGVQAVKKKLSRKLDSRRLELIQENSIRRKRNHFGVQKQ